MAIKIGVQIQKLRKENNITQEELGKALCVSAQAVSKWECGGSPDADMIPEIADFFHVSLDYLYGRGNKQISLNKYVEKELLALKKEDRNLKAFELCWVIMNVLSDLPDVFNVFPTDDLRLHKISDNLMRYLVGNDHLVAYMKLLESQHYFLYLPEPSDGYLNHLASMKEYEELFTFLSKPHYFEVVLHLFSKNKGFTKAGVAKELELDEHQVGLIFEELCNKKWISIIDVEQAQEAFSVYYTEPYTSILPFLLFANEMINTNVIGYAIYQRDKPILSK